MKIDNFWIDESSLHSFEVNELDFPSSIDVAIIGSGYTGLNCARILKKAGMSVAVIDQHRIGWGASSRNGGMATPGLKQSIIKIKKMYGIEYAKEFWQSSIDAIDLLEDVIIDENINCDWQRNGHCSLAFKQSHYDKLDGYIQWLKNELNYEQKLLTKSELKTEIGSNSYYGGITDEISGGLNPAKYIYGLAKSVERDGVKLIPNTRVNKIHSSDQGMFELITASGSLKANEVVIATNGYTDSILPGLQPKVFPVGSYIIVSEPLPKALQDKLSPKKRMFYDSKWFLNYFRLTSDGRMLWGGRNDLSTNLDLYESADLLKRQVRTIFPELNDYQFTHSWNGQLGITFDLMPHIGKVNGVHYALGYGGHGLSIATYLGIEIGKLITGQIERSPYQEIPHPTMFFYRKSTWFLPFVARWYRFLDWIS